MKNETAMFYGEIFKDTCFTPEVVKRKFIEMTGVKNLREKRCLDAGFGGGRFIMAMEILGGEVYGIDISSRNVRNARLRTNNSNLREGSVLDIPYPDSHFDFVCCNGVIHHTKNPEKAFSELVRVTKPGGTLFLCVYGKGFFGRLVSLARAINRIPFRLFPSRNATILDLLYVPILKRYTPDEAKAMFENQNFGVTRMIQRAATNTMFISGKKR